MFKPACDSILVLLTELFVSSVGETTQLQTLVLCLKATDIFQDKLWTCKAGKGHAEPLIIYPPLLLKSLKLY